MRHKSVLILGCATLMLALSTIPAEAQRRHRGGHITVIRHSPLFWGGGFHSGFYHPYYFGVGQWYPHPYPVFGYPPGFYHGDGAVSLRLHVTPRDASVYVDGYAAAYRRLDGYFTLRLVPGLTNRHFIRTTYLTQNIYYNPDDSHDKQRGTIDRRERRSRSRGRASC